MEGGMRVIERKHVQEVKVRVTITVPAWIIRDLGFQPGDERDWFMMEDDKGEKMGALRRIPAKSEVNEEG
ncbi:unnamed protein product [marine sediment metagenome]|uniref:Uncharacterized protein n=1 Tax=marine sediment metagenome TaxID=412755 RepID=X1SEV3_9ZZZZ